jgi:lipoate-protein ligase A
VVEHLILGISGYFDIGLIPKTFKLIEKEVILKIQKEKYGNREWTFGPS